MKASEIRGQSDEQLRLTLADTEKHLFQLRFQSATDRLETPSEIRKAKKDIARLRTEQRRRELEQLAALPDDALARSLAELEAKADGPGKRRVTRSIKRLSAMQIGRALAKTSKTQQPAKGK